VNRAYASAGPVLSQEGSTQTLSRSLARVHKRQAVDRHAGPYGPVPYSPYRPRCLYGAGGGRRYVGRINDHGTDGCRSHQSRA
jgi:hypothetical protein